MKKSHRVAMLCACLALTGLPLMSTSIGGRVSGLLIVRGFNLPEFSPLGLLPLIAPACAMFLKKKYGLLLLLIALAGYLASLPSAYAWLSQVGNIPVVFHGRLLLYPASIGLSMWLGYRPDTENIS